MKIWNFKKQKLDEGVEPPICNGLSGKEYKPVILNYNGNGEIKIEEFNERENNEKL